MAARDRKIAMAAYRMAARFSNLSRITRRFVGLVRADPAREPADS